MEAKTRGSIEMTSAMTISGIIGWFVMKSQLPVTSIVFWRCAFGGSVRRAAAEIEAS